jgi:hypothetical protein
MVSFSTGRTSTEPPISRRGQPFDSSTACVMSLASISIKPQTTSLAFRKGAVVHGLLLAAHHLAGVIKGMSGILDVAVLV